MYILIAKLIVIITIIHSPAPLMEDLNAAVADSFVATTANNQRQVTDLESWLDRIRHGSLVQRREAAANLPSGVKSKQLVDALLDAANDYYVDVRTAAIFSLGDLGNMEVVPLLHNKLASRAPEVRSAAIWALASLANTDAEPQIRKLLIDNNDEVRLAASWYFAKITAPQAREPLLALLGDENVEVRVAAVWGLSATGVGGHIEMVRTKLRDPNVEVRAATARALAQAGDRKSSKALKQTLSDIESSVRIAAAWALTELGEASGPIADKMISGEAGQWERLDAVLGVDAVPFLIALLRSDDPGVRASSAKVLGESSDQRAKPALRDLSGSPDFSDRIAATTALATLDERRLPAKLFSIAWAAFTSRSGIFLVFGVALAALVGLNIFVLMSSDRD